ncbi:MAG: polyprenyl synthetase family protein [Phycisphaerae bacterium]|nr:polyprenyl synthetase family protein [Phycisphaerae bacterium]
MSDNSINKTDSKSRQEKIPHSKDMRDKLAGFAEEYVREKKLVGPLPLGQLQKHCHAIIKDRKINSSYIDFLAVLINNEVWREAVAATPYEKRLLLLPKCLRDNENCPADFDQLGLACENCGSCPIGDIKSQAEELGLMVLIAEGSPIVMSLIQTGKIEAVIGVSCLSVLEKTFPYIEAGAVPSLAIPLLYDGCVNTNVDVDWVLDAIYEKSNDGKSRLDLRDLRDKVNSLFEEDSLKTFLALGASQTETLALRCLSGDGKRWRPLLVVYAHKAIAVEADNDLCRDLFKTAIAVECFHKASLIHDDIEDGDLLRYGKRTMHAAFGIPIALNVGDFLLGEGYRLLAELELSQDIKAKMLKVAAQGHRQLCLGQGMELGWVRNPKPLSIAQVIDIFQKKTSPAFEVALKLGVLSAGKKTGLDALIEKYSNALGIAYQIKDDINDFDSNTDFDDVARSRPSILLAIAWEKAQSKDRQLLESLWQNHRQSETVGESVAETATRLRVKTIAMKLMETYKHRAVSCLESTEDISFKGLLRRIISKIFNEIDILDCCNDYKTGND